MPISKERFATGLTAQEFLDSIELNKEKFLENIEANSFSDEDLAFFNAHPVSIAALAEDWCTDVVHFLPVVIKLAEQCPAVTLRIFKRDENLDIMDQYLNRGEFRSIPTFIVYDPDWNELGYYSERPAAATAMMAAESTRFARENAHLEGVNRTYDNMPDETRQAVRANSARFRWANMLEWNRIFIDELKAIVAGGVAVAD
ncbi:MAG: thioredoxin family protein [Chloroflexi bacterium]|nr:MAG: thioredoxin family protein [Chloroflexota bacterium]